MSERNIAGFEQFEREVMEMIAKENPKYEAKIMAQYEKAHVIKREFTGHGFFTDFDITDPADSLGCGYNNQLGDLTAEFPEVKFGAGFVLFIKNGFIEMLEGAVNGDHTNGHGYALLDGCHGESKNTDGEEKEDR